MVLLEQTAAKQRQAKGGYNILDDARFAVTLDYQHLLRFAEVVKAPFRKALNLTQLEIIPPPARGGKPKHDIYHRAVAGGKAILEEPLLLIPLFSHSRIVALLEAKGVNATQLSREVHPFLAALADTAMEAARLRLAMEIEPGSGLSNQYALSQALISALARRKPAPGHNDDDQNQTEQTELVLLGLSLAGLEALLERHDLNLERWLWKTLGRLLKGAARPSLCLARQDNHLWILLAEDKKGVLRLAEAIQKRLSCLQPPDSPALYLTWRLGAAAAHDLPLDLSAAAAARLLQAKARRAMKLARALDHEGLLFFDEIISRGGRVKEVLSFDRLRINLGRLHGLESGQSFLVQGRDKDKAEIRIVGLEDETALAEVTNLYEPTLVIMVDDQLTLLPGAPAARPALTTTLSLEGRELAVSLDETTPLLNHHAFNTIFKQLLATRREHPQAVHPPLAAVLLRVADLGSLRQITGRHGVDHVFKVLAEKAHTFNREYGGEIICARYAADAMAVLLPGWEQARAFAYAQALMQALLPASERPLRVGVSCHPCLDYAPEQLLDNAGKALTHAEFLEPGSVVACDAVSLNIYADSLYGDGRLAEAAAEYERALLLNPNELNVLNSLGVCYAKLNQPAQAHRMFKKAQQCAPHDYMAYYNEAYTLLSSGSEQWEEAQRLLQHCLTMEPGHPNVLFQLGRVAQNSGQFNQALQYYQQTQSSPQCPGGVYRYLGEVLALAGRLSEAEEAFKKAIKFNSSDAVSLNHLASLYLKRNANREIAQSLAKRAWEIAPDQPRAWQVYALALERTNQLEAAFALLQRGLQLHPEDTAQRLLLAQIQIKTGQTDQARQHLQQVLALEPNMQEALEALAGISEEA
jgi:tetratricopeptide (TPR) repeat protein